MAWADLFHSSAWSLSPHELKLTLNIKGSYGNCWYERLSCLQQKRGLSLDFTSLCDQYLSGPIHREPGVFIAARASAWASHTKGRAGLVLLPLLPYKVGVLRAGAPRHKDTESATKGELYHFVSQHLNNKDPFKLNLYLGLFVLGYKFQTKILSLLWI